VSHILVTGATAGLGLAAARALMDEGHDVVVHARSASSAAAIADVAARAARVVVGDLGSADETRAVARQVNGIGRMHAIIHNAGIYGERERTSTPEGHAQTLAVNTLAPYLLTALIERPDRLIYLSSSLHSGAGNALDDIDWAERSWDRDGAYAESKLYVTALALAIARRCPDVLSNAVNPGWVPTRMGGPKAPDDLTLGYLTQTWLAASNDAAAKVSGGYWYHRARQAPAAAALDPDFQDRLMAKLAALTGISLF
jgi:NAD(P)-dependent dehydrogenase (short-subunit alcohol dehydrogenase family)